MTYQEFLEVIINDGIEGARQDYKKGIKLEGSIDGFNACRNKLPNELLEIYQESNEYLERAFLERADNYFYFRCYQAEIEWVLNVVSAILINENKKPLLPHLPTAQGINKAISILGVKY